uniref:Uncharacterized protein n=1 Tax=Rhizophora mucronata TaxID=61149 RepID=A0A2P2K6D1_RHIMU
MSWHCSIDTRLPDAGVAAGCSSIS